jgi:hypothetical protein
MIIKSNFTSVIERQKAFGVYRPEEFVQNPYNTAYWSGQLTEEICEFLEAPVDKKLSEAADIIIFLQNLSAYLYPEETLAINLSDYSEVYDHDIYAEELILRVRLYLPNRKSWKTYSEITWENYQSLVSLVLKFISQNYFYGDIEKAYEAKQKYNESREDWNREPSKP